MVKYVNDSLEDNAEILADPQEEEDVPTSSGVVTDRSKAKAKDQQRESTGTTIIPLSERVLIDFEPAEPSLSLFAYDLSKKVIIDTIKQWGARSWQEHFDSIHRGEEARQRGFTVEAHPKYVREADGVIELHVDDGHECGKETVIAELLSFPSEIEMKWVQGIKCGSYEYLKIVKVRDGKKLTSTPNKIHLQSALKKVGDERQQSKCFSKIGQVVHRRRQ